MASDMASPYTSLLSPTSIRVLILAPGNPDDEIFCWMVKADLDADHERFPTSSPRPIESMSVAEVVVSDNETRRFVIPFDIFFPDDDDADQRTRTHKFQRYSALSYVWGDPSDPEHIVLDGEKGFPVTPNLHAALRSLRRPHEGIRLWVDALCINQADYEEKKKQIAIMKRVYEQAEEVIAYVPQPEEDEQNILKLMRMIFHALNLSGFMDGAQDRDVTEPQEPQELKGLFTSFVTSPAPGAELLSWQDVSQTADIEAITAQENLAQPDRNPFLERFGLPTVDSPLWNSWRRFFSSPYFQRIWILQEFASAKTLRFHLGNSSLNADQVMLACYAIKTYSGAKNAQYMRRDGDPREQMQKAVNGLQLAWTMFYERTELRSGLLRQNLVSKLKSGKWFLATDPRDKIYAVLGLSRDGPSFQEHVSYDPAETSEIVLIRFARLLIEGGHGYDVLLQAGLGGAMKTGDMKLPSWVPNWANPSLRFNPVRSTSAYNSRATMASTLRILDSNRLSVRGANVDKIQHINQVFPQSPSPTSLHTFMGQVVKAALLIARVIRETGKEEESPDSAMNTLFGVLVQQGSADFDNDELSALRIGFRSFMEWVKTVAFTLRNERQSREGQMAMVPVDSPKELHMFMDKAFAKTGCLRFCATAGGCVGLVPEQAEVGDQLAVFDGSAAAFVLRESGDGDGTYQFVGSGYFQALGESGLTGSEAGQLRDFVLR
ncbi:heterokaryon incompatibility protein-domain-containing protein [Podospora didyma]|uniref:Heterokaryon incompatibility protein-domain-containing protein n=1 Tax=Podospora didyma TaxID=330526 RepID=A0AAE0TZS3_9PEZI|nr:heterokaryon incompatibility protein-domain-containing protein [Podospora didyma]